MTSTDARSVLAESKSRWETRGATVAAVCRHEAVTISELARRIGVPYTTIQNKLVGKATIQPWELDAMAAALHLPVDVLEESPDFAIRWLLDNPRATRGCMVKSQPITRPPARKTKSRPRRRFVEYRADPALTPAAGRRAPRPAA